jgi:hypothetical protein
MSISPMSVAAGLTAATDSYAASTAGARGEIRTVQRLSDRYRNYILGEGS